VTHTDRPAATPSVRQPQQDEVVHGRVAAVGSVAEVVGVARGGWSGAAAGGAVQVAGGEGAALGWGDAVAQGLEAGDLPEG
jgi:hypothetical protein